MGRDGDGDGAGAAGWGGAATRANCIRAALTGTATALPPDKFDEGVRVRVQEEAAEGGAEGKEEEAEEGARAQGAVHELERDGEAGAERGGGTVASGFRTCSGGALRVSRHGVRRAAALAAQVAGAAPRVARPAVRL